MTGFQYAAGLALVAVAGTAMVHVSAAPPMKGRQSKSVRVGGPAKRT